MVFFQFNLLKETLRLKEVTILNEQMLYIIGLVLVLLYLFTGFDDFIWDLVTLTRKKAYRHDLIDLKDLDEKEPKLLAVTIAAWHEEAVLGAVITNFMETIQYPASMFHVFLGVYPNDEATVQVANELAEIYPNIHVIINELPGPTSKAQNINYVIRQILAFEKKRKWRFASLTVHDSEDVVHPYELKVTNYLIDHHPAIQFPVFPLMEMPKFRNFFKNIVTNTYADEFAENHYSTMVSRYSSGAFVPSAGTGFALSHETLDLFENGEVLPKDSLTEDYRLSLTLYQKGIQMYYVLLKVPRLYSNYKVDYEFIATRSRFPYTFKTAIKQKTRWILGITMQSFRFRDIFTRKKMTLAGRYSLYRDYKAKIGNLLVFVGYPVLLYFLLSLFIDLPPIYPKGTVSWYLAIAVTFLMVERQLFRAIAIYRVYGLRSVFFGCLFPPLLPIRFIIGNYINMVATFKAYRQYWSKPKPKKVVVPEKTEAITTQTNTPKTFEWDKTEHHFLPEKVLLQFHRKIGDVLLEKEIVTTRELFDALQTADKSNQRLGKVLRDSEVLTSHQLNQILSHVEKISYVEEGTLNHYPYQEISKLFNLEELETLHLLPLLKDGKYYYIAMSDSTNVAEVQAFLEKNDVIGYSVYATEKMITDGLHRLRASTKDSFQKGFAYTSLTNHEINGEQYILIMNASHQSGQDEQAIMEAMGLFVKKETDEAS